MIDQLVRLRHELHSNPELWGLESETASRIATFFRNNTEAVVLTGIGGNGLVAVFDSGKEGPSIMLRCELDALPIEEVNEFNHRSIKKGVSHKCGHDGHMAILCGVGLRYAQKPLRKGKLYLLFQPSEENGKGGEAVVNDAQFRKLNPDYVFALHNIPGYSLGTIITTPGYFSATVVSFAVQLKGMISHASEPEKGVNPALAISEITKELAAMKKQDMNSEEFQLLTPVHIRMGNKEYGISAGEGELHYTIRTWSEERMNTLKIEITRMIERVSERYSLDHKFEWFDYFPASMNNKEAAAYLKKAVMGAGLSTTQESHSFKFGEDFGWYSRHYKTCMFGLGAGVDCLPLHNDEYDFPDALIEPGVKIFDAIINTIYKAS